MALKPSALQVVALLALARATVASVYAVQEPIAPNGTIVISGAALTNATIAICLNGTGCIPAPALEGTATAMKIIMPVSAVGATSVLQVMDPVDGTVNIIIGLPIVQWWSVSPSNPFQPGIAAAGSLMHIHGKNLAFNPSTGVCSAFTAQGAAVSPWTTVFAVPAGQPPSSSNAVVLAVPSTDAESAPVRSCYSLDAQLPPEGEGQWDIYVNNGLAGPGLLPTYGALAISNLTVVAPPSWPPATVTLGTSPGCDTIPACMAAITALGGGTIVVPAGTVYMHSSSQIMFPANVSVKLQGAGRDVTEITWPPGTGLVQGSNPVTSNGSAPWSISDLTLSLYAAPQPGAQPVQGMDFVHIPTGSTGATLERVRTINDLSGYPGIQLGNALSAVNASYFAMTDVEIVHNGNCASQWPHNAAIFISDNCTDFELRGLNVTTYCPGWSITSSSRFRFSDSLVTSVGPVSQGQGINTLGAPNIVENVYFGNNSDIGNPSAAERWESMTYDGPGGYYNGSVTSPPVVNPDGSQTLTLQGQLKCSPWGSYACLPAGLTVAIMRGTGTGQLRRLVSANSTGLGSVTVDRAFHPAPVPGDSYLSVTGYKGQAIYEGNNYANGTTFQFYGMAYDTIVAGNSFVEMFDTDTFNRTNVAAGLRLFGHRYVGGYEPNWRNIVEDNNVTCTTQFLVYSDNIDNVTFSQGQVIRRNAISGGVDLAFNIVSDPVAEHNTFSEAYCSWGGQVNKVLPAGTTLVNGTSPGAIVR